MTTAPGISYFGFDYAAWERTVQTFTENPRQVVQTLAEPSPLLTLKPDHGLNPDTLAAYEANILRVVPELTYSPWASAAHLAESGTQAKLWRLDLVLFVNGLPVATMELTK